MMEQQVEDPKDSMAEVTGTTVTMKLSESTINRVNKIKRMTQVSNRTQIMATSVKLLEHMLDEMDNGGKVVVRKKDGSEEVIHFLGI